MSEDVYQEAERYFYGFGSARGKFASCRRFNALNSNLCRTSYDVRAKFYLPHPLSVFVFALTAKKKKKIAVRAKTKTDKACSFENINKIGLGTCIPPPPFFFFFATPIVGVYFKAKKKHEI